MQLFRFVNGHNARSGMACSATPTPIVRKQGDAAFERTGIIHWWENRSIVPAQ